MDRINSPASGLLKIDKQCGPTSHDIVARLRRALNTREIGHTGTLDPFASGLMLVCVGSATKGAQYFTKLDKRYLATIRLGATSNTYDRDGEIVLTDGALETGEGDIRKALKSFEGEFLQTPPVYSALKIDGVPSYKRARRGETVTLDARPVRVLDIQLVSFAWPILTLNIKCGSGTYIRSIAHDLGQKLGCGALLEELRRTEVGSFDIGGAFSIPQDTATDTLQNDLRGGLIPLATALSWPHVVVNDTALARVANGAAPIGGEALSVNRPFETGENFILSDQRGHTLALCRSLAPSSQILELGAVQRMEYLRVMLS